MGLRLSVGLLDRQQQAPKKKNCRSLGTEPCREIPENGSELLLWLCQFIETTFGAEEDRLSYIKKKRK